MLGQQSQNWHAKETHSRGYADNDARQFQAWCGLWLDQCLRVLKPGGHLVAFGGTRTWHRLAVAAEDTGFEVRDSLAWIYSTGMPKSMSITRAVEKSALDVDSQRWDGWGTALKPAFEPIVFARRPLQGTMVENLAQWGTGPINVNPTDPRPERPDDALAGAKWPSNVHFDAQQAALEGLRRGQDPERFFWVNRPGESGDFLV